MAIEGHQLVFVLCFVFPVSILVVLLGYTGLESS